MPIELRRLGRSDIKVTSVCLGTMTWGKQNTEAEGHAQMDYALDRGITFFDTAEMYPVPPEPKTWGRTEEIIGTWFASRKTRERIVLATKIAGPRESFAPVRGEQTRFNRKHLEAALDASLKRLQTDYIDLYQLHWPERAVNNFGTLGYDDLKAGESFVPFAEVLEILDGFVKAGKVRAVGLSNETPWGVMRYLSLAEQGLGPRMASVQNPYNLLNRSFEVGLSEIALREDCGLLAYAPIAAGALSGKYLKGAKPEGARMTLYPENRRYSGPQAEAAIQAYVDLAEAHGLDVTQMANAYVLTKPFLTSSIIGATTMEQLATNIDAAELTLSEEVLDGIEAIHKVHTYPCP